jgi:hypothetical protein
LVLHSALPPFGAAELTGAIEPGLFLEMCVVDVCWINGSGIAETAKASSAAPNNQVACKGSNWLLVLEAL